MTDTDIKSVCIARNGERCKDCTFYGKKCAAWKRKHHNTKPCEYDDYKEYSMRYLARKGD